MSIRTPIKIATLPLFFLSICARVQLEDYHTDERSHVHRQKKKNDSPHGPHSTNHIYRPRHRKKKPHKRKQPTPPPSTPSTPTTPTTPTFTSTPTTRPTPESEPNDRPCGEGWTQAFWTSFEDYPRCCPAFPDYQETVPRDECCEDPTSINCTPGGDFDGCNPGNFGGLNYPPRVADGSAYQNDCNDDGCTFAYLETNKVTGFFNLTAWEANRNVPAGSNVNTRYFEEGKSTVLQVKGYGYNDKGDLVIPLREASMIIADVCGDDACVELSKSVKNAGLEYNLDVEFNTMKELWGDSIPEPAVCVQNDVTCPLVPSLGYEVCTCGDVNPPPVLCFKDLCPHSDWCVNDEGGMGCCTGKFVNGVKCNKCACCL